MLFKETTLKGAYTIDIEPVKDDRGYFARLFCVDQFHKAGLEFGIAQCNISYNKKMGTVRGMHYQVAPHEEIKVVRCTEGAIFDAIVDLRESSPTSGKWYGEVLDAGANRALYVPRGFAHGYLSLTPDATVHYMVSEPYHPESERTLRWDDPFVGIQWPKMQRYVVSWKDRNAGYLNGAGSTKGA